MSRAKSERLVNLTLALMSAGRLITVGEISRLVAGYEPTGGDAADVAFRRMFERDKEELRQLGVPVEVGPVDPLYGDEIGYRIRRDAYALPPLSLEPDEAAALGLAARFWSSAELADASASALRKLAAGGVEPAEAPAGFEARGPAAEPGFGPLTTAVRERQAVSFDYRRPGAEPGRRRLEPWGVVSRRGHWYVVGHDRDRDATRVFRLSRITGAVVGDGPPAAYEIPAGVDLRAAVSDAAGSEPERTARVRLRPGTATRLRRRGALTGDVLELAYQSESWLAQELAGHGADVVVLEPPTLRAAVVAILRAAAG